MQFQVNRDNMKPLSIPFVGNEKQKRKRAILEQCLAVAALSAYLCCSNKILLHRSVYYHL